MATQAASWRHFSPAQSLLPPTLGRANEEERQKVRSYAHDLDEGFEAPDEPRHKGTACKGKEHARPRVTDANPEEKGPSEQGAHKQAQ